mmetsp:Transcript_6712/g.11761  ORF Transcript_6712/g.11761 Transcript_6712/m.11761 type:complete len:232 (+) Transcript_6712:861-1556(+)
MPAQLLRQLDRPAKHGHGARAEGAGGAGNDRPHDEVNQKGKRPGRAREGIFNRRPHRPDPLLLLLCDLRGNIRINRFERFFQCAFAGDDLRDVVRHDAVDHEVLGVALEGEGLRRRLGGRADGGCKGRQSLRNRRVSVAIIHARGLKARMRGDRRSLGRVTRRVLLRGEMGDQARGRLGHIGRAERHDASATGHGTAAAGAAGRRHGAPLEVRDVLGEVPDIPGAGHEHRD